MEHDESDIYLYTPAPNTELPCNDNLVRSPPPYELIAGRITNRKRTGTGNLNRSDQFNDAASSFAHNIRWWSFFTLLWVIKIIYLTGSMPFCCYEISFNLSDFRDFKQIVDLRIPWKVQNIECSLISSRNITIIIGLLACTLLHYFFRVQYSKNDFHLLCVIPINICLLIALEVLKFPWNPPVMF